MPQVPPTYQPLVHRTAVATACLALLPIAVGALVTTMKAGMAFHDWPNSDGRFMLTYPWFADFVRGAMDKFVEHGHRLAGMLIGVTSILLTWVVCKREPRIWVRLLAGGVLLGVIVQGLLGGVRVLRDDPRMAMVHGNFAAVVFCVMITLALVTSRRWIGTAESPATNRRALPLLKPLAIACTLVIYAQFILGGRQRHLHDMLTEHLAGAFVTAVFVIATTVVAHRSRVPWVRSAAYMMLAAVICQAALGAGAWVTKLGFPPAGYVAVQGSPLQLIIRSSHTVVGMLLLASSVLVLLRTLRLEWAIRQPAGPRTEQAVGLKALMSVEGGAG